LGEVGMERLIALQQQVSTIPPPKPDVRLSPHPAFHLDISA